MASLGVLGADNKVYEHTYSTPRKKKKNEETVQPTVKNETKKTTQKSDIRTVKTEDTQVQFENKEKLEQAQSKDKSTADKTKGVLQKGTENALSKIGYVGKSGRVGVVGGVTSALDAPLQETQNALQKGEKIKTPMDAANQAYKTLISVVSPMAGANIRAQERAEQREKSGNNNLTNQILDYLQFGVESTSPLTGIKEVITDVGALNKNLDEKVKQGRDILYTPYNKYSEELAKDAETQDEITKTIGGGMQQVGFMAPSIAASALTKNPDIGLAAMALSAKGAATKEAEDAGMDLDKAIEIGNAKAAVEVATEKLFGGINFLGKGTMDDIVTGAIDKKVANKGLNFLAKNGINVGGEMAEEVISDVVGVLIDRGTIDPKATYTLDDLKNTLLQTGLSTIMLNTLTGGYSPKAYRQNSVEMQQNQNNIQQNNQNIQDVDKAAQQLEELQKKTQSGEMSYEQANQQMEQINNGSYQENRNLEEIANQRVQEERAQEEARKAQELAQERQKEQERIREQERQKTLEETRLKQQEKTQKDNDYNKYYKRADLENFDSNVVNKAKEVITSNKQGRRTKQEWLDVADNIGMQLRGQDAETIKKYAYESFKAERPNTKDNLNRQGQKYVSFKVDEWVDAVQKAAQSQSSSEAVQSSVETEQQIPQVDNKVEQQIERFKEHGGRVEDTVPEGFIKTENATTAPKGYTWYNNGKSRFGGEYENVLVKDSGIQETPQTDTSQNETLSREEEFNNYTRDKLIKFAENQAKNYDNKEEFIKRWYNKEGEKELGITKQQLGEIYDRQQPAKTSKKVAKNPNLAEKIEEDVIRVETPQQERKHYVDSGMNEETAKILSEMPKVEKQPLRERIKEGKAKLSEEWSYLKRNLVDKGETIYTLGKKTKNPNLYAKYDKRGTTTGEANYDIGVAQTDLQGKRFNNFTNENGKKTSMSLNQIWEGVDPQVANEYLAHYLNVDRYNQTNQDGTQKYVFGESITDKDSLQRVKELEKEHPELKRFGENVWQYGKNQLQNMVDAGKISQAQADQFLKDTPHYVRLQRNVEKTSSPLLEFDKKGNVKVNKNIKEFKGSTLDILPFKESMAQYTLDVRNGIRDNIFAQELAKTLGIDGNGEMVTDLDEMMGTNPDLIKDNGDGTYSLTFFNKGVATTIPINQGIYESLQPNKHFKFEDTLPFKGIRKFDNVRKALLTDKNPMFLATNMMKDAFDAPLNSKYPASFVKNYPRAVFEILKNGNNYQQYQALGGLQNTYFDNQQFQKQSSKANPLTWIEKANNAIEQIPRLAEFMSTMEKTGDVDQAMYNAAEVTTNFKRGGDVTKVANRNGATFLNASVQGFSKQIRNFTDIQNPRQAAQMLGKVLALGIAPGLLNDLMWDDDDEYKDMQDYQKDRYYLFKGKDGQWIRIPKGRAVSIFQSAARRTKYALGGQKDAFKDFGKFASDQVAPNNPFENNIISPFVDVARNESWSGNPIVSESIKNETHPEEEYTIKTDEFSKWLGKKTGKSPAKINYLIDQYSGALGDIVLPNITKKVTSKNDNVAENLLLNPLKDKFTTNAVTSSKSQNDFYEALSKAEDNKKWSKATDEDKARYKYLYNKNLEISEIRKEMIKVQESNKSNKEKYKEVMDYTKEINKISKEAVENSNKVKKPSDNEFIIGDKHYTVSNGQVNALKDETVQKAKEYGLSVGDYADITSHYGTFKADKDENGNTIPGSKKQKFIDYVEAKKELSEQQKIAIIQKYYKKYTGE